MWDLCDEFGRSTTSVAIAIFRNTGVSKPTSKYAITKSKKYSVFVIPIFLYECNYAEPDLRRCILGAEPPVCPEPTLDPDVGPALLPDVLPLCFFASAASIFAFASSGILFSSVIIF